ncbi:MAG: CapA family protein [Bacteroidota bacterium]
MAVNRLAIPLLLLLLWGCSSPETKPASQEPELLSIDSTFSTFAVDSLRLLFAGDIMGHGPQIKGAERIEDVAYDYTPCFKHIKPLLEKADFVVGNLELTLPGKPPYQGFPYFRSPDALSAALGSAGFDLLLTSNNHANDAHQAGLHQTIETLRTQHFYQTGTFKNELERALYYPLLVYRKSFRLAFLNYTYGMGRKSRYVPRWVNQLDTALVREDLEQARRLRPDAIIVCVHWGKEYKDEHNSKQRQWAMQMLRWGADLIVGAHPHVVQPIEERYMKEQNGHIKKTLVAYSLGNFISNQRKPLTDGGILLDICLKKTENGRTEISDYRYHPIWRHIRKRPGQKTDFEVLPIRQAASASNPFKLGASAQRQMKRYEKYIRQHLGAELEAK